MEWPPPGFPSNEDFQRERVMHKLIGDMQAKTGINSTECRKALEACDNDVDRAIVWYRETGARNYANYILFLARQLRDQTGADLIECKKAVIESNSNIERAMDYLRRRAVMR